MAIVDATSWQAWSGQTLTTDAEIAKTASICAQVDKAIKTYTRRTLELQTFTALTFAATRTPNINLFRYAPIVVAGFDCRFNLQAAGDPTQFGSDTVLTIYQDYTLSPGLDDPTLSDSGVLTFLQGFWGCNYYFPPYSLAAQKTNIPGAIQCTFTGGYDPIPDDLMGVACLAVSRLRQMAKLGFQKGSESWNGYAYSLPGIASGAGILNQPDISEILDSYRDYAAVI